ncbi:hypothetical protein AB3S75_048202 [Citrus x aurantiifolia]
MTDAYITFLQGFAVVGLFKYPTAHIGNRVYGTVCLGDPLLGDTVQPTLDTPFFTRSPPNPRQPFRVSPE